jgi:flagellar assembly protein FliH
MALAIARKVAGQALDQNAQAAIDEIVLRCSETMMKEPKITITVHESMGDTLAKKLEELAARLQSAANIVTLRDPAMPAADCRIEWNQGGIERQTAQIWQQVEKMIEDIKVTAIRNTQEQLETLRENSVGPASGSAESNEVTTKPNPSEPPAGSQDAQKKE